MRYSIAVRGSEIIDYGTVELIRELSPETPVFRVPNRLVVYNGHLIKGRRRLPSLPNRRFLGQNSAHQEISS